MKLPRPSLAGLLAVVLLGLAVTALVRQLSSISYDDLLASWASLPTIDLLAAGLLTLGNYVVLSFYDLLALRSIGRPLSYGRIAMASFISSAYTNNLGFAFLSGGSVRFSLYAAWGLSPLEIGKVIAFTSATLWLGLASVGGVALLAAGPLVPWPWARWLGMGLVACSAAYLAASVLWRKPLRIRGVEFSLPEPSVSLLQVAAGMLDWILAAAVLYALLPKTAGVTFPQFLAPFLVAMVLGVASQTPGGLGVFESAAMALLADKVQPAQLVASLLAFRLIYYLGPLLLGTVLLALRQTLHHAGGERQEVGRLLSIASFWAHALAPRVLAMAVFACGMILLVSGATPAIENRLGALDQVVPLPLMEVSHFIGSLTGLGLLILARGLQRRLDAAYYLTALFLVVGILASLFKGFDYEEATLLLVMLLALLPCHAAFYRKSSLLGEPYSAWWFVSVALVVGGSVGLGLFSYGEEQYSRRLWWQFTLLGDESRFLRSTVGVTVGFMLFALARLVAPMRQPRPATQPVDMQAVARIVAECPHSYANLAFLGDKSFLMSDSGQGFLMYAVEGQSWIAMGDPVCPPKERTELLWRFRELSDRYAGQAVFYEVGVANLPLYLDLGLSLLKMGEEAVVYLADFSMEGKSRKNFRNQMSKLEREGCTFEMVPPMDFDGILPGITAVSRAWMQEKSGREKRFSLGNFNPAYLRHFPTAVVRHGEERRIVAFANIWVGGETELSFDLMRYLDDAPAGVMDFLILKLLLWGKEQGFARFNLGMAPFSGIESRQLATIWNRFGSFLFQHGEAFYNFQGLRHYKEKFDPVWEPRYLACPGGMSLPRILANLTSLVSRGLTGAVGK